mgnify:CR=1 FL=1
MPSCEEGQYTATSGEATCLTCGAGSITDTGTSAGATACTACAAGKYSTASTERRRSWVVNTASTARKRGRGTGRTSNLSGSECSPSGRGGFGGIRSTAKFPTVGHRPILKTRTPESIPSEHWQPRYQRSTECFGRCCSTDRIMS